MASGTSSPISRSIGSGILRGRPLLGEDFGEAPEAGFAVELFGKFSIKRVYHAPYRTGSFAKLTPRSATRGASEAAVQLPEGLRYRTPHPLFWALVIGAGISLLLERDGLQMLRSPGSG